MKKTIITAFIVAASVSSSFAQEQKADASQNGTWVKAEDQTAHQAKHAEEWQAIVAQLNLSEDQKTQVEALNKAFGERRANMEKSTELTDEAKAERRTVLLKAQETQFLKILTADQQAKYKELVAAKTKELSAKDH